MRIIAGEFRGRKLLPPASEATRPITDRVKQSVFDILTSCIDDAIVYDCFAGTGSMGLECLSRGAQRVIFFENERSALERLKRNISALGVNDRTDIVPQDLFDWFGKSHSSTPAGLLFLDPPYRFLRERSPDLQSLAAKLIENHLTPDAIVVFRHDAEDSLELPHLVRADLRSYGSMTVEFLSPDKRERIG